MEDYVTLERSDDVMIVRFGRLGSSRLTTTREVSDLDFILCIDRNPQRIFTFIRSLILPLYVVRFRKSHRFREPS